MVLSPLALVVLLAVPLLFGAATLRALGLRFATDRIGYLGWAWLVGCLGLAVLETVRLLFELPSPRSVVTGAVLASGALLLVRWRASPVPRAGPPWKARGLGERLLAGALALVLLVTLTRILRGSLAVMVVDDETNFWALRAKLFFQAGSFGGAYAEAMKLRALPNGSYPFLNPLLQLWVFDLAGTITHQINRLPIEVCSFALYLCAASAFRRWSQPWIGAALLVLLATCSQSDFVARKANSDVLVALGALVAVDALARWRDEGHGGWLGLASLAGAFLLWSKKEGTLYVLAFAVAWCLLHARDRASLRRIVQPSPRTLWVLPLVVVLAVTTIHNTWFDAAGSYQLDGQALMGVLTYLPANVLPALAYLFGLALKPSFNLVPAMFLVLAVVFGGSALRSPVLRTVPLMLLVATGVCFLAFVKATPADLDWLLDTAGTRVLFQAVPLELLWIAALAQRLFDASEEPRPLETIDVPRGKGV